MDSMSFWAGWAFGVLCGILLVLGATWAALHIQAARAAELKTFRTYVAAVAPEQNLFQRIALYGFIVIWAIVEAIGQMRPKQK